MKTRSTVTRIVSFATTVALASAGNLRRAPSPVATITSTSLGEPSSSPLLSPQHPHLPQHVSSTGPLITQRSSEVVAHSKEIHLLAAAGDLQGVQELLEREPYWIMARDEHGWTPLHEAARGAHIEVLDFLLSKGAELNAQTFTGATPLYEAEKYNGKDSRVVHYLNSLGALRKEAKSRLRGGLATSTNEELIANTVPHQMAAAGHMDELNQLADVRGEWVLSATDERRWTPLHEAARAGQLHVVRFLLDHGVALDCLSSEGGSPLHYARVFQGHDSETARFLEEQGALSLAPSK